MPSCQAVHPCLAFIQKIAQQFVGGEQQSPVALHVSGVCRTAECGQAIQSYNNALLIYTRLYFDEGNWKEAYQIYLDVITVRLDIFTIATGDAGRLDAIKKTSDAYNHAVYSAVQLGNYYQALTHLEAGKARLLAEAQALADSNLNQLNHDEREQLQILRDQIKALEYEARLSDDHPARREYLTITTDLGKSRQEIRQFVGTLRAKYPDFMPEGLSLDTLLNMIPVDGALVALLFNKHGSIIFIVPSGVKEVTNEHVLFMDDFRVDDLEAISREKDNQPGWLRYYVNHRFGQTKIDSLLDGITDVTRRLWDGFIGQVHQRLQALGVKNVLLIPQGDTNLLPLHLAWREVDGLPRYFMDDYQITYTPSMATFATARRKSTHGEGALVVGVSEYQQMNNLPNTKAEVESIASLFNTSPLLDHQATIEVVCDGVRGKAYVHLSCHGGFGWGGDAFTSSLVLGDGQHLSLPEIMSNLDLDAARLVVLSACETGIVDFGNTPDEFIGLSAGFLQAGASAVISSLWSVDDRSTALLMERMYKNIHEHSMEPRQALIEAQFWLRDATAEEIGNYYQQYLIPRMSIDEASQAFIAVMMRVAPHEKPYAHPFYWGAFTYNGV